MNWEFSTLLHFEISKKVIDSFLEAAAYAYTHVVLPLLHDRAVIVLCVHSFAGSRINISSRFFFFLFSLLCLIHRLQKEEEEAERSLIHKSKTAGGSH